ncbi:MAG: PHP domain-containing protein [Anaerolineaceae bacterium]|nr:PHP domain-containing protein [Anaerolineaceae bacterium]
MITISSRVDLHSHTTASDGGLAPQDLVARAASLGIEVLAITDHDTTTGVPAALAEARRLDIVVVPGVEISALSGREEIHLLGYFVDVENEELQAFLGRTRVARRERAEKMLARLAQLGLPVEWERVVELAGEAGSIGRPHVATTLLEAGLIHSWDEAFERWIGRGCPAYVERYKLTPEDAIDLVRASGGLPVLAHPYIYTRKGERKKDLNLKHWLPRLVRAGLAGIEVYYPNYPRRVSRSLLEMALYYGLMITGGSDFHGGAMANGLGSVDVPWAAWEGLERRHRLSPAAHVI